MRIVLFGALLAALVGVAFDAGAELYRWRDPQTGSIKYSSYPPPWYGDESRAASAPRVEVLGGGNRDGEANAKAPDAMAEKVAEVIRFMEQRREQLLSRMTVARASAGFAPTNPAFRADLEAYRNVTRELDKFDPKGASARRKSDARVFENLGIEPQSATEPPAPGSPGAPPRPDTAGQFGSAGPTEGAAPAAPERAGQ
ncbi:MAG: hypothetical protein LJE90_04040 [Betaproteobacteria bacterium]|nr:hypothetical protein [Betaproteobacteria bacterium]